MSLATNVSNLATAIATEMKSHKTLINGNATDLSALTTTAKTNLVAAVNEVKASVSGAAGINDTTSSTSSTYSSSKTDSLLAGKQPLDSDLTTIAGLTATTDNIIQSKLGAWSSRTPAQFKTDLALVKGDVGLGNVDNTSDVNKPVSTATSTALAGKQPLDSDLTTIAGLTATTDSFLQAKASAWAVRTPAQVKVDLALVKADVGLGNVDNTADTAKPVSTAQQTALDAKAALVHTHVAANITDFSAAVDARISTVVNGAPTALDTLKELADAIGDDPNYAATVTTALGNRLRFDAVQTLTAPQQTQGLANLGAAAAADLTALTTAVGDTTTNFVTVFNAGLV